jgi:RNA polymerase sigma factor (sigma-70 family)
MRHLEMTASRGRTLLEEHFGLIQRKLDQVSRRSGLPEHEAEELRSWALLRLVENDYRILGSWEGRSSFSTYLNISLINLMRDYRIHIWGKWRPSAAASRHGREAVLLERLWLRDHLPLGEAIDRVLTEPGAAFSRERLEQIALDLPLRTERRTEGEEKLLLIAIEDPLEEKIQALEDARLTAPLRGKLLGLLRDFPAEDRLLLKLHYRDGLTIAAIAPLLGMPQKQVYSRRDRCLRQLRQALLADTPVSTRVREILRSSCRRLFTEHELAWE